MAILLGHTHAEIHHTTHSLQKTASNSLTDRLSDKISNARVITDPEKNILLARLKELPEGNAICHGDFHPGNVMLIENYKPIVIDWAGASIGNPLADVARSQLLMHTASLSAPTRFQRLASRWASSRLERAYIQAYFETSEYQPSALDQWQTVIAGARLAEYIPAETEYLVNLVRSDLGEHT